MAYWLDDGFDTWPEVVRAGKAATGLYVCCGAWIARSIGNGTLVDPVVPAEVATMYGTPEWVAKLVAVGLWRTEGAGYRDVKYFTMGNPAADKVAARRKADADRKARWREKRDESRRDTTRDSPVSHSVERRVTPLSPALPPLKGEGGAGAQERATPRPTRCSRCGNPENSPYHRNVCAHDQELPLPWQPPAGDTPATPMPAPTSTDPPTGASSAQANAKADPTPSPPKPRPRRRSSAPAKTSPPAPPASPPPATTTPAAGNWPIVYVLDQQGQEPTPAELREEDPNRPDVVKVVYLHSRTGAWVARSRITPKPTLTGPALGDTVWMATERHLAMAHRPDDNDLTACRRSMRTGVTHFAQHARSQHGAVWCPTCWPPKETTAA